MGTLITCSIERDYASEIIHFRDEPGHSDAIGGKAMSIRRQEITPRQSYGRQVGSLAACSDNEEHSIGSAHVRTLVKALE